MPKTLLHTVSDDCCPKTAGPKMKRERKSEAKQNREHSHVGGINSVCHTIIVRFHDYQVVNFIYTCTAQQSKAHSLYPKQSASSQSNMMSIQTTVSQ